MARCNWKTNNVVVEAGNYHVTFDSWKDHTAKDSGNPCVIVTYLTEAGEPIADFLTLTDAAMWKVATVVEACSIDIGKLAEMDTASEEFRRVLNQCKGKRLYITVTKEKREGKDRNSVVGYCPDGAENLEVLEDDVPDFIKNKVVS